MVTKNEIVRRQSVADFNTAIDHMAKDMAELLCIGETLPDLRITSKDYAVCGWSIPVEYIPILERVAALLIVHRQYEPSDAQLHLACLQGVTLAGKLWIDDVLQEARSERQQVTARSGRFPLRVRTSFRNNVR